MNLCVTIPTYSRPNQLLKTLEQLNRINIDGLNLIVNIQINPSNKEDIIKYKNNLAGLAKKNIKEIVLNVNNVNIGAPANILRSIESVCDYDWIWLLGDDDIIEPDAGVIIKEELEKAKKLNYSVVKFSSNLNENSKREFVTKDVENILSKEVLDFDYFSNLLFMSNYIYRGKDVKKAFSNAYLYTGSFASHVILMLLVAKIGGSFYMTKREIVQSSLPEEGKWNPIIVHNMLYESFYVENHKKHHIHVRDGI